MTIWDFAAKEPFVLLVIVLMVCCCLVGLFYLLPDIIRALFGDK